MSSNVATSGERSSQELDRLSARRRQRSPAHPARVSIVVAAFNEDATLAELYREIGEALSDLQWELILVDDGSSDGTFQSAAALHHLDSRVSVIKLRRNFGKTAALAAGIAAARGGYVVTMDADLQDDPREIPGLLAALESGYDLVAGWRRDRRDTLSKRISSVFFNRTVWYLTGVHLHDMNCGLKACKADVARDLKLYGELHRFMPVLAAQKGYRVGELPVNHRPREHGRSKYGWTRAFSALFDIQMVVFLTRYLGKPLRLFGSLGLLLGGIGFALALYLSVIHFMGESIGQRPLLTLAVLLLISGLQMVSVGLVGEMLRNLSFQPEDEYSVETLLRREASRDP